MTSMNCIAQRASRAVILMGVVAGLSGCGASVTPRDKPSTSSPSIAPPLPGAGPSATANAGAECNMFDSTQIRLAGRVTTYYNNGSLQEDKVRVRITGLTEQFDQSADFHLKMFRWKADSYGQVEIDNNPLSFVIEKGSSRSVAISEPLTSINAIKMASLRQTGQVSGTTTQSFLDNTLFVVSGVDYNWDALKIVIYKGTEVIGQSDFLLPVFSANPNLYASNHPGVLAGIHPFWSQRTTQQDWSSRITSFCF